jgi:Fe-S oxidoreductase
VIDDELWDEIIQLTDGALAPCFQCGVCTASCPWGEVREEPLSVRDLLRQAQLGLMDRDEFLWLCTACSQCEAYCPRGVPIAVAIRDLRYISWKRRNTEKGLPAVLWSVYWNNNPWFQAPSQRTTWAKGLDIPIFEKSSHELLLYVGCTASYDGRAQQVAKALVSILQNLGVPFGILGENEPCCGESVLSVGHRPYFEEVASNAVRIFQEQGVQAMLTVSPHCYDVFKHEYPPETTIEPHHYTQMLAQFVREGRMKFENPLDRVVTFQDPCFLGRKSQEFAAPREILDAIPGIELIEMPRSKQDAMCCGGGGGRMWMETALGERFADLRIQEAADLGVESIITACPSCITCLEDSAKTMNADLEILDLAELVAISLQP